MSLDFATVYTGTPKEAVWLVDAKPHSRSVSPPAERLTLLSWQRSPTLAAGLARRARLLLLLADGMTITEAAATVGLSRNHSYKWIQRFMQEGLAWLEEKPGRGHRRRPRLPDLREEPNHLDVGSCEEGAPLG
jgi:Winged helix-turn helix